MEQLGTSGLLCNNPFISATCIAIFTSGKCWILLELIYSTIVE